MANGNQHVRISDGSMDFSGGVDSSRVTTIASDSNPNGLRRNQLAWLVNGTVRDGGITTRHGWVKRSVVHDGSATFQCSAPYYPDEGSPFSLALIGGRVYYVEIEGNYNVSDMNAINWAGYGVAAPFVGASASSYGYMCQAENFMVIQSGTRAEPPMFWTGGILRHSAGYIGLANPGNEIPGAGPMDYYMGRLWYAGVPTLRHFVAGDIVQGPSGSAAQNYRDSVIKVTENPQAIGGDGFLVPTIAGNIRAIKHTTNINSQLGVSELFVFTRKSIYGLQVPVSRADWILAGNGTQGTTNPTMRVIQSVNGSVNDRTVVPVNGDLFYQSLEPGIRSLSVTVRNSSQWGNLAISSNIERLLNFNDRSVMFSSSGCVFNNRMFQTALPEQSAVGVISPAIAAMDFEPITSFGSQSVPVWQGHYEGLQFLQIWSVDFNGVERCFGYVLSRETGEIELWELTDGERFDYDDRRVTMVIETPAFTFGRETMLKELDGLELWIDRLYGDVNFKVEYRPDSDPCWYLWNEWRRCTARNSCEDLVNPVCYPITEYYENYRASDTLGPPQQVCQSMMGRPTKIGYQFQLRITVKGWCRIRMILPWAILRTQEPYHNLVCYTPFDGQETSI